MINDRVCTHTKMLNIFCTVYFTGSDDSTDSDSNEESSDRRRFLLDLSLLGSYIFRDYLMAFWLLPEVSI